MRSINRRRDGGLDVLHARHRTSAYVYGNITVLGAVVAVDRDGVEDGHAVVAVAATALATFVAHITADMVSERVRPDHVPGKPRQEILGELRDATPIASSAALPVLFLLLGTSGVLGAHLAQVLSAATIVVRLAAVGPVTQRLSGRPRSAAALWGGLALAALSAVIAVVKAVLTH